MLARRGNNGNHHRLALLVRTVLNLVWFVLAGCWLGIGYLFASLVGFLFVVTAPVGLACFRMARYVVWPFGKAVVPMERAGAVSGAANLVWFVVAGWWLALGHVVTAVLQAITIVGIPNAVVCLKMIPLCCFPFGKRIVDRSQLAPGQMPLHAI